MALGDNLVAHWKFNSALTEEIGGYTLTGVNSPGYAAGKLGNAVDMESGSTQYAYSTDSAFTFMHGAVDFTVAFWMKMESSVLSMQLVNRWHSTNAKKVFGIDVTSSDALRGYVYTTSSQVINGPTLVDGTDYFVVLRRTTSTNKLELIVNAGTPTSITLSGSANVQSVTMANTRLTVAASAESTSPYDGLVDSLSMWSRAVGDTEVGDLFNSGSGLDDFWVGGGGGPAIPVAMRHYRGLRV